VETSPIERICDLLDECYGSKEWADGRPILDELIYTILSQNTSAANCDQAFRQLTSRFGTWEAVMGARIEDIANAIRSGGLANRKAPRIRRILQEVFQRQGNLDLDWIATAPDCEAINYLLAFDGVGRKTAACVLMFSLGRPVLPVDTHVHRVAMRLGLIGKCSADDAHDLLQAIVAPDLIYSFHVNMVAHGRMVCHARGPECPECALNQECVYFAERARSD
jgi:endonuclease-3